jgi:hypothetical protein
LNGYEKIKVSSSIPEVMKMSSKMALEALGDADSLGVFGGFRFSSFLIAVVGAGSRNHQSPHASFISHF